MNALIFFAARFWKNPLPDMINTVRATKKINIQLVMSPEDVAQIMALMEGVTQLIVKFLYRSGLRIMEAVRLLVQDIDFQPIG
jgi:integrase